MKEADWDLEELDRAYEESGERMRLLDEWLKEQIPIMVNEAEEADDDEPCALRYLNDQMYYDERLAEDYKHLLPWMTGQTYSILSAEWERGNLEKKLAALESVLAQIQGLTTGYETPLPAPKQDLYNVMTQAYALSVVRKNCDFGSHRYYKKLVNQLPKTPDEKRVFMRDVYDLIEELKTRHLNRVDAKTRKERGK